MAKKPKKTKDKNEPARQGGREVFSRYITLPNGKRLDAADYGKRAWHFFVPE